MPATTRHHNPDQQPQPIYRYTRTQAIDDGMLIEFTKWARATNGFHGGLIKSKNRRHGVVRGS